MAINSFMSQPPSDNYDDYPVYTGNDLGVQYHLQGTTFKVWAPKATGVKLRIYNAGSGGLEIAKFDMKKSINGTWEFLIKTDLVNKYYTFQILQDNKWSLECPDIYAKAVGVNGKRGMIVNLNQTNPVNWHLDTKPPLKNFNDIIIYELHLRDVSMSATSGIKNKGKYSGLTELGTRSPGGLKTGLDHLKELGITHLHLLPTFDFNSIDETTLELNKYNWGYDPLNYNVPEGSYSSDPYDGNVRIKEFKQLISSLHKNGIRVILDVVYNHTSDIIHSNFNQFAPGYFYRKNIDGSFSDATGCGNETASERTMVRKFILESVIYWTKEYHLDGFRFDLMGVHDIQTMNAISDTLHKIDPTIFIYGEGWSAGQSPLSESLRAIKANTSQLNNIAAFNDDLRDGIKGGYNDVKTKGFASGAYDMDETIKFGIVAATQHSGIDYNRVNYSKRPWAAQPFQSINYVSCHDDNTLFDKIILSNPGATECQLIKSDILSNTIILTSQGIPFLHAGEEILRTKKGVHNSYNSPDSINEIDWTRKTTYKNVFDFYQALIKLRKDHPAFRMSSAEMIENHLNFIDTYDPAIVAYTISKNANNDEWKDIYVAYNGNPEYKLLHLPEGNWTVAIEGAEINQEGIRTIQGGDFNIQGTSTLLLFKK